MLHQPRLVAVEFIVAMDFEHGHGSCSSRTGNAVFGDCWQAVAMIPALRVNLPLVVGGVSSCGVLGR